VVLEVPDKDAVRIGGCPVVGLEDDLVSNNDEIIILVANDEPAG